MTDHPSPSPIRVAEISGDAAFAALTTTWRDLFDATPDATPFDSYEWLSAWRRRRGRGEPLALLAYEDDIPIAAMPLMRVSWPFNMLRWMGAPDSDYHDMVGGRRREECAAAFLAHLDDRPGWRLCDLRGLRPAALSRLSAPLGPVSTELQPCAALSLPASREEFERAMSRKLRWSLKRGATLLKDECGDVSFSTVTRAEDLPAAMDDLFRLHTARLNKKGDRGAFAEPSSRLFHREIAEKFLERGWLRLHRATAGGSCIAALYCFHLRGTTYYYLGGFDPAFSRFSPGALVINHAIVTAIDEGAREFDFMRGAEEYKSRWKAESRVSGRIVFGPRGRVSRVILVARRMGQTLRGLWRPESGGGAKNAAAQPSYSSNTPSSA